MNTRDFLFHTGSYAAADEEGISLVRLDRETGRLSLAGSWAAGPNPSFLVHGREGRLLASVNEGGHWPGESGGISIFTLDEAGGLHPAGSCPSLGRDPCHLLIDAGGTHVVVANYTGGGYAVCSVDSFGRPGEPRPHHPGEFCPEATGSAQPHAHAVVASPCGRWVLSCDLGLDRVFVHKFSTAGGNLDFHSSVSLPKGHGPRHAAFHPDGRRFYVINEYDSSISLMHWDPEAGSLSHRADVSTLPPGWTGTNTCAEIAVHPSGRLVYASNRGHDSIAVFEVREDGALSPAAHVPCGGNMPRHFALSPDSSWLLVANQASGNIASFPLDPAGMPGPQAHSLPMPAPVCVVPWQR